MRQAEARAATRYFGEGVSVGIWCYSGDGQWELRVTRDGRCNYIGLDELKRAVWRLRRGLSDGVTDLVLYSSGGSGLDDHGVTFNDADEAASCISEIGRAVDYIRSVSKDTAWEDVTLDVFRVQVPAKA